MRQWMRALDRERRKIANATAPDLWRVTRRYAALHRSDAPSPAPVPRPERVVLSMTTIPSRVPFVVPALRSLLDQDEPADALLLWVGPEVDLPPLPAGVTVRPCEDLGPATKLVHALGDEADDSLVIAVDDDVIYPRDLVRTLLRWHRAEPDVALGYRGWHVDVEADPRGYRHVLGTALSDPEPVDILLGTWALAVQPRFFDAAVAEVPEGLTVDDVWFSGHLFRQEVPRLVVPARLPPIETRASRVSALTDGPNRSGAADTKWIRHFWG